jgi:hypothetical protein
LGIIAQASYFTNGIFDWIVLLSAKNIRNVKKFVESLRVEYSNVVSDIQILEILFPLEKEGIDNPNRNKLREFFR